MYPSVNRLFFRYRPLPLIKVTSEKRCTYRILIRSYLNPVVLTLTLPIMGPLSREAYTHGIKCSPQRNKNGNVCAPQDLASALALLVEDPGDDQDSHDNDREGPQIEAPAQ